MLKPAALWPVGPTRSVGDLQQIRSLPRQTPKNFQTSNLLKKSSPYQIYQIFLQVSMQSEAGCQRRSVNG